jgi:hypothetical protein
MGEEVRRETGDKRMVMQTVHCRRREKKEGEGRRREKVEVRRTEKGARRREKGDADVRRREKGKGKREKEN